MIIVSVDGEAIGVAQEIILRESNSGFYSITSTRVRFNGLQLKQSFNNLFPSAQNQALPLQITFEANGNITRIHNAWITNSSYTYTSSSTYIVTDVEIEAEAISSVKTVDEKCKYCAKLTAIAVNHTWLITEIEYSPSKENLLRVLGITPLNAQHKYRLEAIEIFKGHFPEQYNKMEGLFTLI